MASPRLVVKKINQLGLEQTVNLVKENQLKFKQTVMLVKSFHLSELVLTQKSDFVQPEISGIVDQKTINPMIKLSGRLLDPVKVDKP